MSAPAERDPLRRFHVEIEVNGATDKLLEVLQRWSPERERPAPWSDAFTVVFLKAQPGQVEVGLQARMRRPHRRQVAEFVYRALGHTEEWYGPGTLGRIGKVVITKMKSPGQLDASG